MATKKTLDELARDVTAVRFQLERALARSSALQDALENITESQVAAGAGLEADGEGALRRSALIGDVTAPAGSNTTTIAAGAVGTAKVADGAITAVKVAAGAVTTTAIVDANVTADKLATDAVTTGKIAANAVTTAKITDANVTTAKIADLGVTTGKLAASAVTAAKIADATITAAKMADESVPANAIVPGAVTVNKIGSGAVTDVKLASSAVTTAKIADAAVTAAKMATNAVATTNIVGLAVTEAKIADSAVATAKIADLGVTSAKLADSAVATAKIAANAVDATKLASNAVTTAKILDANVTTAKIADANVTTAKIADANVTTAKIADANVTTAKIADANVTNAKLATMATKTVKANVTGGTAVPTDITMATLASELPLFASATKGLVPSAGTVTGSRVLHDDGTFRVPGATALPSLQQKWSPITYVYPDDAGAAGAFWDYIEEQAALGRVGYVIFNPASGPGYRATFESGGGTHADYSARLASLRALGVKVIGYQSTNYFDQSGTHSGDPWAGSVAGSYRFVAATDDTITIVDDGGDLEDMVTGVAPGSAQTVTFPAGFGPIAVKSWSYNLEAGTTLPGGLALNTSYWLRPTGATPIATYTLHTSKAGALANTGKVDITSTGGGSGNGPFWLGIRRTPALAVGADGTVLAEMDRWFSLYPDLDGLFFDEADVDVSARDSVFDAMLAHRDTNHPGKLLIFNGTPHSSARADAYDGFMIENSWANLLSGAEVLPAWLTADETYSSKAWLGANAASTNWAAAQAFSRENNFGHVAISSGGYSGTDLTYFGNIVDAIVEGNGTPEEAEPPATPTYGSCSYTEGNFVGSAVAGTTFTPNASYAKVAVTATATGALNSQVTFSNTSGGRLTYTGTDPVNVRVSLCMSFMKAAGEEVLATMRIYRSGTGLPDIKASAVLAATKDAKVFNFEYLCTLTSGQYIEPFMKAVRTSDGTTANDDVFTLLHGMMTITEID